MQELKDYINSEWEKCRLETQKGQTQFLILNGVLPDQAQLDLEPYRLRASEGRHLRFSESSHLTAYGPFLVWIRTLWLALPAVKKSEFKKNTKPLPIVTSTVFSFLEKGFPDECDPFPAYPAEVAFYSRGFDRLLVELWSFLTAFSQPQIIFLENLQFAPDSMIRFLNTWFKNPSASPILFMATYEKPVYSHRSETWDEFQKLIDKFSLKFTRQPANLGRTVAPISHALPLEANVLLRNARFAFRFLALEEARRDAQLGLNLLNQQEETDLEDHVFASLLGDIHNAAQQNDTAILFLNQALQSALHQGDLKRIGLIYLKQSFIYLKKDDLEEANLLFNKAIKLVEPIADEPMLAWLSFLSQMLATGRGSNSVITDVQTLATRLEKMHWNNLASILRVQPFYLLAILTTLGVEAAVKECFKVIRYCRRTGHEFRLSVAEHAIGMVFQMAGDDIKALIHYHKAIRLRCTLGNKLEMIKIYNGTGYFSFTRGRFHEAIRLFEKSLRLLEEVHDFQEIALTLFNIGSVYIFSGNSSLALQSFEGVLRIMDELHLPGMPFHNRWEIYALMGISAFLSGFEEKARDSLHLCLVSSPPSRHDLIKLLDFLVNATHSDHKKVANEWEELSSRLTHSFEIPMEGLIDLVNTVIAIGSAEEHAPIRLPKLVLHIESILDSARQEASLNHLHKKINEIQFLNNLQAIIVHTSTWQDLVRDSMHLVKNSFLASYLYLVLVNQKNQKELVFSQPDSGTGKIDFWKDLGQWADVKSEQIVSPEKLPAGIGSLLALPLVQSDDVSGAMICATSEREPPLSTDDLKALSIAVRQIAMAVELKRANEKLIRAATIDSLTGLLNRQEVYKMMANERKRVLRYKGKSYGPFSLLFIDLDNFKYYNDEFGHAVGDLVLLLFADLIRKVIRDVDIAGRFGGDEFLIILPETDMLGAKIAAQRIFEEMELRKAFQDDINSFLKKRISIPEANLITCSIGITEFTNTLNMDIEELVARADNALYEAKRAGKNRVVLIDNSQTTLKPAVK